MLMEKSAEPNRSSSVAVSVIVPAYNAAPFIAQTIESVLNQTFRDFEVIVVNDGSPDTVDLERELAPYIQRITYLTQSNGGPSSARNLGIRTSRGEYVAFLDSDDFWMPEFLERQLQILKADPRIDLLYSNGVVIGDVAYAGRELMSMAPSDGPITFERVVSAECTVLTSCVVVRRQTVVDAGLFDERFRRSEDFHLWSRLAFRGARFACHRGVLVQHRRREGSLSDDRLAMAAAAIDALQDLEATLPLDARQKLRVREHMARCRAYIAFDEGKRSFMAGQYDAAVNAFGRSRTWEPGRLRKIRLALLQIGLRLAPRLLRRTYGLLRRDMPVALRGVS
jgi:glycosyltransferase involved in cell wall biosynthesis